jgi:transcriptional regulator with XRE-family HTH domain
MQKNSHNIKEIRQLYNLTQGEFAAALGITRELVNKIEKGKIGVSKATAALVRQFVQERSGSEGFSHRGGEVAYLGLPRDRRTYREQRLDQKNEASDYRVPLVAIKAQAGYVKGFEQVDYIDALEQYSLPPGVNPTGAIWRYFEVDGESMEPTLFAGDVLLASMLPHEDWKDLRNYGVYILLTAEQLLVKRVYRLSEEEWVLISDNEEAAPQVRIPVSAVRQVWTFRRHIRSRLPEPKEVKITA